MLARLPNNLGKELVLQQQATVPEPRNHMLPGVRCQTCAANGQEVWVIPGRACGYCRTPAPSQ